MKKKKKCEPNVITNNWSGKAAGKKKCEPKKEMRIANENDDLNDHFMVMIIFEWIPTKKKKQPASNFETHFGHRREHT